jgi:glycosyltransferase involved in cell wall biosynthesis
VELIDFIPSDKVPEYYQRANVFCIPSIKEALGQVQMEAMAAKTPVVGTNVGGIPETITQETGILISPRSSIQISDAIIKIFSNPALAKHMGNKGHIHVKKFFNAKDMGEKTYQVYLNQIN